MDEIKQKVESLEAFVEEQRKVVERRRERRKMLKKAAEMAAFYTTAALTGLFLVEGPCLLYGMPLVHQRFIGACLTLYSVLVLWLVVRS